MSVLRLRVGGMTISAPCCVMAARMATVIAAVCQQPVEAATGCLDERGRHRHIGRITGRDQKDTRASGGVGQSVELR